MEKKLKVQLISEGHSQGRGIGFYEQNLTHSLKQSVSLKLVDQNPDIVHYTFFDLFRSSLKKFKVPTVVTIHDLTPLVMSSRYPKGIRGTYHLLKQWFALRKVDYVITDSESSKRDIAKYFWIDSEKIFVVPLAVDSVYSSQASSKKLEEIKNRYSLPNEFVLTVAGGPNPNKNLPSLAEVTERLNIPLVIVGGGMIQKIKKPVHPELIDLVRLEVYPHIIKTGYVSNEDLLALYKLASVYIQASYYEGFGLPLLEAMSAGCPVISSRTSSLPEIYGPQTITFNPKSLKSMENAIKKFKKLKGSKLENYISSNKIKSKEFTWTKTAKATISVYQKAYEIISKHS